MLSDGKGADARRFFDIAATFEKPVLPRRGEHLCRFRVEMRTIEPEQPSPVAEANSAEVKNQPPLSHICLILDVSGSMSESGKYELLQEAVRKFVDRLTEDVFVSAVAFSQGAEQIIFARPGDQLDAEILLNQLDRSRVKFGDRTQLAAGMRVAERLCRLFRSENPSAVTRIYMMTDGMIHDYHECLDCAKRFIALEAEAHTFGIGRGDYDLTMLRDITSRCVGGTVKLIRDVNRFVLALERAGKTTARIFATGVRIKFRAAPGVLCNQVFLFRPREEDVSASISPDSSEWQFVRWPNIESKRSYQILFETLLPSGSGDRTPVGTLTIEGSVGDTPFREAAPVAVSRDRKGRCEPNGEIRKAFTSCAMLSSRDPDVVLEALQAKRDLYLLEGRHEDDIQEIEDRIKELKNKRDDLYELGEDAPDDIAELGDAISQCSFGLSGGNGSNGYDHGGISMSEDISGGESDGSNGGLDDDEMNEDDEER